MEIIANQEGLIRKYLEENNREAAIKLLFELIAVCASEKNFEAAEEMRDRIFEINPMAPICFQVLPELCPRVFPSETRPPSCSARRLKMSGIRLSRSRISSAASKFFSLMRPQ